MVLMVMEMQIKVVVTIALTVLALALIVTSGIFLTKVGTALDEKKVDVAKQLLTIIRNIAIAIAMIIGGAAVSTVMTGCAARRAITVQGTVINSHNPDSVRIIISSQESYVGRKKQ
jgi:predicted MFS family arabinose efflux permease